MFYKLLTESSMLKINVRSQKEILEYFILVRHLITLHCSLLAWEKPEELSLYLTNTWPDVSNYSLETRQETLQEQCS